MKVYRCQVCGYLHVNFAPERCPVCGAGQKAFGEYVPPDLKGTKTLENLKAAFAGESQANRRYLLFRQIAVDEGMPQSVVDSFKRPIPEETAHALSHLIYTGEYGSTKENLEAASKGEAYEHDTMYAEFADTAEKEGYLELASYFRMVGKFENEHKEGYLKALGEFEA